MFVNWTNSLMLETWNSNSMVEKQWLLRVNVCCPVVSAEKVSGRNVSAVTQVRLLYKNTLRGHIAPLTYVTVCFPIVT